MDWTTASEYAYNNGYKAGYEEGYRKASETKECMETCEWIDGVNRGTTSLATNEMWQRHLTEFDTMEVLEKFVRKITEESTAKALKDFDTTLVNSVLKRLKKQIEDYRQAHLKGHADDALQYVLYLIEDSPYYEPSGDNEEEER